MQCQGGRHHHHLSRRIYTWWYQLRWHGWLWICPTPRYDISDNGWSRGERELGLAWNSLTWSARTEDCACSSNYRMKYSTAARMHSYDWLPSVLLGSNRSRRTMNQSLWDKREDWCCCQMLHNFFSLFLTYVKNIPTQICANIISPNFDDRQLFVKTLHRYVCRARSREDIHPRGIKAMHKVLTR